MTDVCFFLYWLYCCLFYLFRSLLWGFTLLALFIFLATNITCAILIDQQTMASHDPPLALVYTRVIVNDSLFIIYAILLAINIYKVSKLPTNYQVLESQVRYGLHNPCIISIFDAGITIIVFSKSSNFIWNIILLLLL